MTTILDAAIHQLADEITHPLMNGREPWTAAELRALCFCGRRALRAMMDRSPVSLDDCADIFANRALREYVLP